MHCTITKVNNKQYMPLNQGRSAPVPSYGECYLRNEMSLTGSWPIAGYPLVSPYSCSLGCSTTCWYVCLLKSNERHCKSSLSPRNAVQKTLNRPHPELIHSAQYGSLGHCTCKLSSYLEIYQ